MSKKSSFALIIPCYNEKKAIPQFTKDLAEFFDVFHQRCPRFRLDVVIVDNNSTDGSTKLLEKIQKENSDWVHVIPCSTQGYGAALKAGFASIDSDWYGFADLDNTYPLTALPEMLHEGDMRNLDIVFGNRLKRKTEMPFIRRIGNLFYSYLSKFLFKNSTQDMCTGMRVFRDYRVKDILYLQSNDLKFSIEFTATALKNNWRYLEVPIDYRYRLGESKLSVVRDGFLFLFTLLKVKWSPK